MRQLLNVDVESENDIIGGCEKLAKQKQSFDLTQTCECCVCGSDICAKRRNDVEKDSTKRFAKKMDTITDYSVQQSALEQLERGGCQ